jgi:NAD(P)-dependent dehydrogenase (short-subunit alcohol dehydrogenase family)
MPLADLEVQGRTFAVTGAASGIGDAVARRLKAAGARVVSLDLRVPEALVDQHIPCDLSDPDAIDSAVAAIDGDLDGLCNVAGVPGTQPAQRVFAVNFLGLRHLTETLLPRISPEGAVVNVASTAGWEWSTRLPLILEALATSSFEDGRAWLEEHAPDDVAPYHFSKELVTVYTMAASLRAAQRGLRINAVSPGPVDTPILPDFEESMGKEVLDGVKAIVGRHGTPADIAPVVVFLLSPASGWVNGENLMADGGAVAAVVSGAAAVPTS